MAEKHKTFVLDASFILSYLLPDENSEHVQEIIDEYKGGSILFRSIRLLPFEVINGMYAATLSQRLDPMVAQQLVDSFLQLPITLEDTDHRIAFDLAKQHRISVYDASYVVLARLNNVPLLSLDKRLQKLAR